jgi:hypothetical protein
MKRYHMSQNDQTMMFEIVFRDTQESVPRLFKL